MEVFVFRHAERDNSGDFNPDLSPRGHKQAQVLSELALRQHLPHPQRLICSPKKRAQNTFAVLSQKTQVPLTIQDALDERHPEESLTQFKARIQTFLNELALKSSSVIYICSHMDWLEEALILIPSDTDLLSPSFQTWPPGKYLHFHLEDKIWHFLKSGELPR